MSSRTASIRDAIKQLPQLAAQKATETPDLRSIFIVRDHEGAIDPNREIVVGDRGVGKSFWSSVLQDSASRTAVAEFYPKLQLKNVNVSLGFSEDISKNEYPTSRVLRGLVSNNSEPEDIWRAVILNAFGGKHLPDAWSNLNWQDRANWIRDNAEEESRILNQSHEELVKTGKRHLLIFDALDRLGQDWKSIKMLAKGLLMNALDMQAYSNFCIKIFLRPDMDSDSDIWSIRDSSKLRQRMVHLVWEAKSLYGFFWYWLIHNPDSREDFIDLVFEATEERIEPNKIEEIIEIPKFLIEDEIIQKKIFSTISGEMMGAGSKKGHPYTWIPKHLADAKGHVSLRSFIVALREAARATQSTAATALTYEPIKKGVQEASLIRVSQLKEDYGWIEYVLTPLYGLQTPNTINEFISRWKQEETISKIIESLEEHSYIIPVQFETQRPDTNNNYLALIRALKTIGVAEQRPDERLNIPDLFQVASGMLRKGGVPPVR